MDGIYDMVKGFLKEYNTLINEMDKLYNADSAKGYEPLTDDEKDAMSDTEVEKYEQKIKDALLRRDSNLSTISSALKEVMSAGIEINGKTMYLSNFGTIPWDILKQLTMRKMLTTSTVIRTIPVLPAMQMC